MTYQFLTWLALPLAFGAIVIGCLAIVAPEFSSRMYGAPSDGHANATAWVRATGARDIFLGLVVLFTFMHGHFNLLGEICAAIAVVAATDAFVTWQAGARKQSSAHIVSSALALIYGLLLIYSN